MTNLLMSNDEGMTKREWHDQAIPSTFVIRASSFLLHVQVSDV
ncbi:MAG TPA: hypothetical protein VJ719_00730 [Chthoniobacterales bacterium]|nr:hypothetical protein [Chthoniobacterales bacterium]